MEEELKLGLVCGDGETIVSAIHSEVDALFYLIRLCGQVVVCQAEIADQDCPGGGFVFSDFGALLRPVAFLAVLLDWDRKDSQLRINSRPYALDASHTAVRLTARSM